MEAADCMKYASHAEQFWGNFKMSGVDSQSILSWPGTTKLNFTSNTLTRCP